MFPVPVANSLEPTGRFPPRRKVAMKHYQTPGLVVVAIMAAFWAYTIIDSLIREFSKDVTFID
jgi:hypothetical protein